MPPKRTKKTEETQGNPQPPETQPVVASTSAGTKPPAPKPAEKSVDKSLDKSVTKAVEAPKSQQQVSKPSDTANEDNQPLAMKKTPSTIIKLDQSLVQKKIISLQNQGKSEREISEFRAFKFGGKQTSISIDDASKLISERARKFGGEAPLSTLERKKRVQKFGGVDIDQEKEKKKQRLAKFGKNDGTPPTGPALTAQEQAIQEQRKKKFMTLNVPAPQKQQKVDQ